MAKELPYFKFEPTEWMNGDIQMCGPVLRIAFLEMCCIYWIRTGDLSKKMAIVKCCHGDATLLHELVSMNIVEEDGENVIIKFLDEQLSDFTEIKRIRSEAGKKGGQQGGVRPDEERISGNQFYVIRCFGNGESFLKIGTTVNSVSRRYSGKMPYEYELVLQILSDQSTIIENSLCIELAKFAYAPKLSFPGQKECYSMSFLNEISDIIKSKTGFAIAKLKRNEAIREENKREENKREEVPLRAYDVPFVNGCLVSWNEWENHRKEIKKKLTPSTAKKQIQFLGGRGETEIIAIINQSITNGWTGLFELKQQNQYVRTKETPRSVDAIIDPGKDFGIKEGF